MASCGDPSVVTVDVVCGTLQAKLNTRDLSSGSSSCILFGSRLMTPCDFQRLAGKASAKNWKATIRYLDQPLSRFLESYIDTNSRRCCRFVDNAPRRSTNVEEIQANSQPPDESDGPSVGLAHSLIQSQPLNSDNFYRQLTIHHPIKILQLPNCQLSCQLLNRGLCGGLWTRLVLFTRWTSLIWR